ncbi:MAG TPA: hypothetical protein VK960_06165 [Acidimicrobiia bacterium]|nr:hypothetical protein [Acidimicrobiia bacterium]
MDLDRAITWVTATGAGLVGFMVSWLIMNRVSAAVLDQPLAALVAMASALVIGTGTILIVERRLDATVGGR